VQWLRWIDADRLLIAVAMILGVAVIWTARPDFEPGPRSGTPKPQPLPSVGPSAATPLPAERLSPFDKPSPTPTPVPPEPSPDASAESSPAPEPSPSESPAAAASPAVFRLAGVYTIATQNYAVVVDRSGSTTQVQTVTEGAIISGAKVERIVVNPVGDEHPSPYIELSVDGRRSNLLLRSSGGPGGSH
jgi:hypothetical protein